MFKELVESSFLLDIPVVVMLFFMLIFVAVLIRVASGRRSAHYRAMSQLPLDAVDGDETLETEGTR